MWPVVAHPGGAIQEATGQDSLSAYLNPSRQLLPYYPLPPNGLTLLTISVILLSSSLTFRAAYTLMTSRERRRRWQQQQQQHLPIHFAGGSSSILAGQDGQGAVASHSQGGSTAAKVTKRTTMTKRSTIHLVVQPGGTHGSVGAAAAGPT